MENVNSYIPDGAGITVYQPRLAIISEDRHSLNDIAIGE